jgi:primosomal protein N''
MAIPWFQIARLVPEIVAVSRELLQQTRNPARSSVQELAARVAQLEENERKQAELVAKMAQQIAVMTEAGTSLRRELLILRTLSAVSLLAAIVALILAL